VRTPRWSQGAYTLSPRLTTVAWADQLLAAASATSACHAVAAVESWAGTREELLAVARDLLTQVSVVGPVELRARMSLLDGRSVEARSLDDLSRSLDSVSADEVALLRVDLEAGPASGAAMTATRSDPGVRIRVWGDQEGQTLGAAQLVFQKLMIGYVDRLGGWRALIWMATALAPLLLVSIGFASGNGDPWARTAILTAGLVGSLAVFLFSYPLLLVPGGFVLLDKEPPRRVAYVYSLALRFARNVWTRKGLALLGALLVGIVGNKLAELIPWP